jgi:ABC-type lipoprotein release transport system permease subunit
MLKILESITKKYWDFILQYRHAFEQNANLYNTMRLERRWSYLQYLILIIAAFNMVSAAPCLYWKSERYYLAFLNMGTTKAGVRKIFLAEAYYLV